MRKLLCRLFGHVPDKGYYKRAGAGYFRVVLNNADGIGRVHATLYTECERCGVVYQVGRIHVPKT